MFISVLELFKIGIGPSSSHTMGPMVAAKDFIDRVSEFISTQQLSKNIYIRCTLKGSLAFTGKGHATDRAVALGLHGYTAAGLAEQDVEALVKRIWQTACIDVETNHSVMFSPEENIIFDQGEPLAEHPNGMIFQLLEPSGNILLSETYFSIGGGFINTLAEITQLVAPLKMETAAACPYPFDSARSMLQMSTDSDLSIADMKRANELTHLPEDALNDGLDAIWQAMQSCIEKGLKEEGYAAGWAQSAGAQKICMNNFRATPKERILTTGCAPMPWR